MGFRVVKANSAVIQRKSRLASLVARRSILRYKVLNNRFVRRNRLFFSWVFNVVFRRRLRLGRMLKGSSKLNLPVNYFVNKRRGPSINLRIQSLQSRLLKHGHRFRSRRLVENLVILLTENSKDKGGLSILNSALLRLEPPYGLVSRRRGRETFVYPVPIWPTRRRFLAARLLVEGATQFQLVHRCSFLVALYSEVRGVYGRLAGSFSRKLYNRLVRLGLNHAVVSKRFVKRGRF